MRFSNIGDKIRILDRLPLRDEETRSVWKVRTDGIRKEHSGREFGPCHETVRKWLHGAAASTSHARELVEVLNAYFLLPRPLTLDHVSDTCSEAEFMNVLGYDEMAAHRMQAALWAETNLVGSSFMLDKTAREAVINDTYAGLYRIVRTPMADGARPSWEELRLAVTGVAPVSTRGSEKRRFVNCLLAVPASDGARRFQYRGTFTRKTPVMTWIFFQEDSDEPDMFVMMTDKGDFRRKNPMRGRLLTASEGPNYVSLSYDVRIEFVRRFASPADMEAFLKGEDATMLDMQAA